MVDVEVRTWRRRSAVSRRGLVTLTATWVDALEAGAPDVVAAWRSIEDGSVAAVRREVHRRSGHGTAESIATQLGALAVALADYVEAVPEPVLRLPGGEADWNVAQTIGHACDARAGLGLAAALAARGRWPAEAPDVVPGVPGAPGATSRRSFAGSPRASAWSSAPPGRSPATRRRPVPSGIRSSGSCSAASGWSSPASTT